MPEGRGGIFYQAILEAEAEAFSVGLSEDVRRGMYETAKKCQVLGPLPYGLKSDKNKKIVVVKKEADVIRLIFEMYIKGESTNEIAKALNSQGVKTRKKSHFKGDYIGHILKNDKYCGKYIFNSELISNNGIPNIVSCKDFDIVQEKLSQKHSKHVISSEDKYVLSGHIYCSYCESKYIGDSSYGKKKKMYRYYTCKKRKQLKGSCDAESISKSEAERYVITQILANISFEQIKIIVKDFYGSNYQKRLAKNLKIVKKKIKNITEAICNGVVTETTKDMLVEGENEKRHIETEIKRIAYANTNGITDYSYLHFLRDLKNKSSTHNFIKILISACMRTIYVENCQKIEIIYLTIE